MLHRGCKLMGYAIGDYRGDVVEDKDELETKFAIEWAQRLGCNTKEELEEKTVLWLNVIRPHQQGQGTECIQKLNS